MKRLLRPALIVLVVVGIPLLAIGLPTFVLPLLSAEEAVTARRVGNAARTRVAAREKSASRDNGYEFLARMVNAKPPKPGKKPPDNPYVALAAYNAVTRADITQKVSADGARDKKRLRAFQKVLPRLEAAILAPNFVYPSHYREAGTATPTNLAPLIAMGDSLRVLGADRENAGRPRDALRCYALAVVLGERLGGQGNLAGLRASLTIQARAVEALLTILPTFEPDAATTSEALAMLKREPLSPSDFVRAMDEEFAERMRMFDRLLGREISPDDLVGIKESPSMMGRWLLKAGLTVDRERRLYIGYVLRYRPNMERLVDPPANGPTMDRLKMHSAYHSTLSVNLIPDFVELQSRFREVQSAVAAAEILLTVQLHRERKGVYPRSLPRSASRATIARDGKFEYSADDGGVTLKCTTTREPRTYTGRRAVYFRYRY
ncbi:MAG: hypothetical protein FJX76_25385 [Armatimonadetes bacterium]|nr:hypothetical protein [Armatimonadota bacterium]